jgi:hypothetical protein
MSTTTARMTFLVTAMVLTIAIEATPTVANGPRPQRTPSDLCLDNTDLNSKLFNCPPATTHFAKDDGRLKPKETLPKTLPPAKATAKDTCSRAPTLMNGNKLDTLKSCGLENSPTSIRPHPQSNGFSIDFPTTGRTQQPTSSSAMMQPPSNATHNPVRLMDQTCMPKCYVNHAKSSSWVPVPEALDNDVQMLDPFSMDCPCPPHHGNVHHNTCGQHRVIDFSTVTGPKKITKLNIKKKNKKKEKKRTAAEAGKKEDRKEKKMNRERKLNDAIDVAEAKGPVSGAFKNETKGLVRHVPVPLIHRSWDDAMDPNVCQGHHQKLYNQGKFIIV